MVVELVAVVLAVLLGVLPWLQCRTTPKAKQPCYRSGRESGAGETRLISEKI
jgi:hypothetical protein